jgi:hypothetical protein
VDPDALENRARLPFPGTQVAGDVFAYREHVVSRAGLNLSSLVLTSPLAYPARKSASIFRRIRAAQSGEHLLVRTCAYRTAVGGWPRHP